MKVYTLEYDILDFSQNKTHRVDNYSESDLALFIEDTKRKMDSYYIENLKAYSGELTEIKDLNKIVNPF